MKKIQEAKEVKKETQTQNIQTNQFATTTETQPEINSEPNQSQ